MIQVSIISMLILIIVLHTVFTHLINWAFRKICKKEEAFSTAIISLMIAEALLVVQLFQYYLK